LKGFSRLTPQVKTLIRETAPVVAPLAKDITRTFYPIMFENNPEAGQFFNKSNQAGGRQALALANALVKYASNLDQLEVLGPDVRTITAKHCALNVKPEHYSIVYSNLMLAIEKVLGEDVFQGEVKGAWSEAILGLAEEFIGVESALYKQSMWDGFKEFTIRKKQLTDDICQFSFSAMDDPDTTYDFQAGQYLTLKLEGNSPRHYTLTSKPGENFLQCTIKKLPHGAVSNLMHDKNDGDIIHLRPPYGDFEMQRKNSAVLLSAGIGITPMHAFKQDYLGNVSVHLHVDHSAKTQAYHDENQVCFYTSEMEKEDVLDSIGKACTNELQQRSDTNFYLCGPPSWMLSTIDTLHKINVPNEQIKYEAFGPSLNV